jgi:hypothetical protein
MLLDERDTNPGKTAHELGEFVGFVLPRVWTCSHDR